MRRPSRNNAGFTLVELMIALVISLILLVGVLHIMLNNQNSLKTQHALAGLQSRARLLNVILDDSVASAGYHVNPSADKTNVFPAATHTPQLKAGSPVAASSTSNTAYLRARFQAAGSLHDCYGNTIGHFPSNKSISTLAKLTKVRSDFALEYNANKHTLYCRLYATDASIATGKKPLFSNIRSFKTRFGLDTNGDGSADTFVSHLSKAQQSQAVSIRVQALLQTKKRVLSTPITRTFHLLNNTNIKVQNSRRAYLLFDRTVAIKNSLS